MKHKKLKFLSVVAVIAIVAILASLIYSQLTSASAFNDAREIAKEFVPGTAFIQDEDKGDDEYYFQFFDAASNETFHVYVERKDFSQVRLLSQVDNTGGSEQVAYSRDEIIELVHQNYSAVEIQSVTLIENRNGYLYEVFFTGDSLRGQLSINPMSGIIIERSLRFGNPMLVISLSKDADENGYLVPVITTYISLEEARLIALEQVKDARIDKMEYDEYQGRLVIEIEMSKDGVEYEMKLDAQTGDVLYFEQDAQKLDSRYNQPDRQDNESDETTSETTRRVTETSPAISSEQTKAPSSPQLIGIANVKKIIEGKVSNVTIIELELEKDNGRVYYEGEAIDSRYEYEFEIDAYTGALIKWERDDLDDDYHHRDTFIGTEKVKQIVLSYVPGGTIIEIELDEDDGKYYYEVEVYFQGVEHEFEIDAYTGALIDWEIDD